MKKWVDTKITKTFLEADLYHLIFILVASLVSLSILATFCIYGYLSLRYEYVNQLTSVEDWAYTNIAARNFLQFGFLHSGLLQDYSPTTDILDHPFVYNHMPPGPDIFTALLLKIFGYNYSLNRIIFAFFALPGFYYFFKFTKTLLSDFGKNNSKIIAAIAVGMIGPLIFLNHMQKEVHSIYLLCTFSALFLTHEANKYGKNYNFYFAVLITFFLSVYIQYILLAATVFIWIYLYIFELYNIKKRQLVIVLGVVALGILVHLLQNLLFLGPELFGEELKYVLGNRIVGYPSQESLKQFYALHGIVHHGAQKISIILLLKTIAKNLYFNYAAILLILGILVSSLFKFMCENSFFSHIDATKVGEFKYQFGLILRLFAFAITTVLSVIFLFPAHTQEVNLSTYGQVNQILFTIPCAAILAFAFNLISTLIHLFGKQGNAEGRIKFLVVIPVIYMISFIVYKVFDKNYIELAQLKQQALSVNKYELLGKLKRFEGQFYMSNVNVPVIGFFTKSPGLGVCGKKSIGEDGAVNFADCKLSELKRDNYWRQQEPSIFVYVRDASLFSGFATCWPKGIALGFLRDGDGCNDELGNKLANNYKTLESNELFDVYDLHAKN